MLKLWDAFVVKKLYLLGRKLEFAFARVIPSMP